MPEILLSAQLVLFLFFRIDLQGQNLHPILQRSQSSLRSKLLSLQVLPQRPFQFAFPILLIEAARSGQHSTRSDIDITQFDALVR